MEGRIILIANAIRRKGDWGNIYQDIVNKVYPTDEEIEQAKSVQCVTMLDEDYPNYLKQIKKPPFVLFYKGNKALLNDTDMLAVVGSRSPKETTLNFTEKFVSSRHEMIINGLSMGVATKALKTALKNGNNVVAVLGCGIDYCYPAENQALYDEIAQKGLLISEYPFDTLPEQHNMVFRNRIISGLCKAVCVMDLIKRSGTLVLVDFALEIGKDIYVKPDLEEEDNPANSLIEEGATCLTLSTKII